MPKRRKGQHGPRTAAQRAAQAKASAAAAILRRQYGRNPDQHSLHLRSGGKVGKAAKAPTPKVETKTRTAGWGIHHKALDNMGNPTSNEYTKSMHKVERRQRAETKGWRAQDNAHKGKGGQSPADLDMINRAADREHNNKVDAHNRKQRSIIAAKAGIFTGKKRGS